MSTLDSSDLIFLKNNLSDVKLQTNIKQTALHKFDLNEVHHKTKVINFKILSEQINKSCIFFTNSEHQKCMSLMDKSGYTN